MLIGLEGASYNPVWSLFFQLKRRNPKRRRLPCQLKLVSVFKHFDVPSVEFW